MIRKRLKVIFFSIIFISSLFFIVNAQESKPNIDSLDPSQGPIGTEISIKGTGFGKEKGSGKVNFYKNTSASIISWSDKEIVCKVPSGATSGNMSVSVNGGTKSNSISFKILTGVLVAPVNLKSENITTKTVTLKWDEVKGASGYTISMGTDEKATNLKSINLKTNIYDKPDLEPNKTYYWKIKAISSSTSKKNSGWSRIISFKTKAEEVKPSTSQNTNQNKGINTTTLVILAVIIFIVLFGIFMFVRFLLKKRRQGLDESELNPEPEETPLRQNMPENIAPVNEPYPKPGIDNISGPSEQQPSSSDYGHQRPEDQNIPPDQPPSNLPPSSPGQPG